MKNPKLANYLLYLQVLTNKLNGFFENQKEYIACTRGCGKCCKKAQFPFTEIEFLFLLQGFFRLDKSLQEQIMLKIEKIISDKKVSKEEKFRYDCPFLINNECSVYHYRGIICRSFGLMYFKDGVDEKSKIPFCAFEGLNYSTVIDKEKNNLSEEKYKKLGYKEEPKAFNISYRALTDDEFGKGFDFEFGEIKPLIDWFDMPLEDAENNQ